MLRDCHLAVTVVNCRLSKGSVFQTLFPPSHCSGQTLNTLVISQGQNPGFFRSDSVVHLEAGERREIRDKPVLTYCIQSLLSEKSILTQRGRKSSWFINWFWKLDI